MGWFGICVLILAVGCVSSGSVPSPFEENSRPVIRLTVDNQDFRDATVYAVWSGQKERVGMVVGKTVESFTFRWRDHSVRFWVDFVGGGGFAAEGPSSVWPGDQLEFLILPRW